MKLQASKARYLLPSDFLKIASEKYYPQIDWELYCEPFAVDGKPHWSFDNFRCNGAVNYKAYPLFYTQPSWGLRMQLEAGKDRVKCVTYAIDPDYHKPVDTPKIYDVGFIGQLRDEKGERQKYLEMIDKNFKVLLSDNTPSDKLGEEYSKCKVIFNHIRYEEINIRFFEGMALGAMVCSYSPNLHLYAEEGKHYLSFRTPEEAKEKINYLLHNEEIRNNMAINARNHVIRNHTYKHRVEEMLRFMNLI